MGYGTGAIMAVPAHDERDFEFAQKYNLHIRQVVEPYYIQTNEPGKVRQDLPIQKSDSIIAVVKHWTDDKYLALEWKEVAWGTFLTGTIEPGHSAEETAYREITEETGYVNLELKKDFGYVNGLFYHVPKKVNKLVRARALLFELSDDTRQKVSDDESAKHEVKWLTNRELAEFLTPATHQHVLRDLTQTQPFMNGEGLLANSGSYDGLASDEMREKIVADLASKGLAKEKVNFRMRDWSVSRQRYWGAPIPIIHCPDHGPVLVPDKDLPVILPGLEDFQPSGDGRSALARATDWLGAPCPECGKLGERETDTLDTYICSSWYMLRYFDPSNNEMIFDSSIVDKWMPIDFYNGADHATAHMIYARFVTRFFHKKGLLNNPEPFKKFLFNGKVTAADGQMFSKSKGNGVDPLEIIEQGYGADALRTYLMFAAPLELWAKWDPKGVPATHRFLSRVWTLTGEFLGSKGSGGEKEAKDVFKKTHQIIIKVTDDIENQRYNTAIAALMEFTNYLYKAKTDGFADKVSWAFALESLVMMIAPFAPHVAEELWHQLGREDSVNIDHWPQFDTEAAKDDEVTIAVQVNGKLRSTIQMPADAEENAVVEAALAEENVQKFVSKNKVLKTIYVPSKLLNLVV